MDKAVELYRYGIVDGTPVKEILTFIRADSELVETDGEKLISLQSYAPRSLVGTHKWFWHTGLNFLGIQEEIGEVWDPYEIRLREDIQIITEPEYFKLLKEMPTEKQLTETYLKHLDKAKERKQKRKRELFGKLTEGVPLSSLEIEELSAL